MQSIPDYPEIPNKRCSLRNVICGYASSVLVVLSGSNLILPGAFTSFSLCAMSGDVGVRPQLKIALVAMLAFC